MCKYTIRKHTCMMLLKPRYVEKMSLTVEHAFDKNLCRQQIRCKKIIVWVGNIHELYTNVYVQWRIERRKTSDCGNSFEIIWLDSSFAFIRITQNWSEWTQDKNNIQKIRDNKEVEM